MRRRQCTPPKLTLSLQQHVILLDGQAAGKTVFVPLGARESASTYGQPSREGRADEVVGPAIYGPSIHHMESRPRRPPKAEVVSWSVRIPRPRGPPNAAL